MQESREQAQAQREAEKTVEAAPEAKPAPVETAQVADTAAGEPGQAKAGASQIKPPETEDLADAKDEAKAAEEKDKAGDEAKKDTAADESPQGKGGEEKTKKKTPRTPGQDPGFRRVIARTNAVANQQGHNNPAQRKVAEARAAAKSPANEADAIASGSQVDKMAAQEPKRVQKGRI